MRSVEIIFTKLDERRLKMGDESESVRKQKEIVKELAKQENTTETDSVHSQPDTPEKTEEKSEGFFKRTWGKVKTGASRAARKGVKTFSKDSDDMTEEEFNERLKDLEGGGDIGYASRYYKLIDELSQMPSLMALTKQSEGQKDKEEAVSEAVKETQKEETKTTQAKEPETAKTGEVEARKSETAKTETEEAEPEKEETVETVKDKTEEAENGETAKEKTQETEKEKTETKKIKTEKAENGEAAKEKKESEWQKAKNSLGESVNALISPKYKQIADDTVNTVKDGGGQAVNIYKTSKRQKTLEKLAGQSDETTDKGRELRYMASQTKKEKTQAGFDIASTAVNKVSEMLNKYGSSKLGTIAGKIAGYVNQALAVGKEFMSKKIEKQSLKNGVKGLIGGTDAYKKLKERYKLHGQDMRRAIRTAAKHSSVSDLVNADRDKLSENYAKKAKDKDGDVDDILGLAGGMDEKAMKKALGRT